MSHPVFSPLLVGGLEIVPTQRLALGIGGRLVWLQQFYDGQMLIHSESAAWNAHDVDFLHIIFDEGVQN